MKTAFIIAEYNPFHNGHRYHIEQTKAGTGADAVCAVMSGNFVQRGDIAIGDKFLRAETAVRCGADLVVELPVKYAVSNAVHFAEGAVETIYAFGVDGIVSFGASARLNELRDAVRFLTNDELQQEISEKSRSLGKTFPAALDAVLREKGSAEIADVLNDPNNVLAMEYLKSLSRYDGLHPFAVERLIERGHHSETDSEGIAAATRIRELIYRDAGAGVPFERSYAMQLMPEEAAGTLSKAFAEKRFPADRKKYDIAAYSRLLCMDEDDFAGIDNVSHGLENRIVQTIRSCSSLEEAIALIKSKRYTMARLRQIFTSAVLGIRKENVSSAPTYLRVLAFNETGRELLGTLRSAVRIPLVTNLSDVSGDPVCAADVSLEYAADKLFDLCLPVPRGGNRPFLDHPVYVKNSAG